jgi:Tfp pilus assembly major pilin PilA
MDDPTAFDVPQTGDPTAYDVPQFDAPQYGAAEQFDIGSLIASTTAEIAGPDYAAYTGNFGGADNVADSITSSNGVSSTLGTNWLSDGFSKAMNWFDGQKDFTKGATVTLAGSFLKGFFSNDAKNTKAKLKIDQQIADASTLKAQTDASATQQKFANASSIGQTNFGAPPAGGLIYSNKLAGRQIRAGYGA